MEEALADTGNGDATIIGRLRGELHRRGLAFYLEPVLRDLEAEKKVIVRRESGLIYWTPNLAERLNEKVGGTD